MIVINHTTKTVTYQLLEILGYIKHLRTDSNTDRVGWKAIREIYLSIDNLFLEMQSGLPADKDLKELYDRVTLPDSLLYSQRLFSPPKEIIKPKKKMGRPKKKVQNV